jgi:ribosome-binding ATPase YchF (GTP1/OBG family)
LWINPLRTIEPNTGVVEVPEPRCAPQALISRVCGSGFEGFCPRFA